MVETKVITGKNPQSVIDRINEASEQANGILLNITSNISGLSIADAVNSAVTVHKNIVNVYINIRGTGYYYNRQQVLGKTMTEELRKIK